jgi:hypothetical protein
MEDTPWKTTQGKKKERKGLTLTGLLMEGLSKAFAELSECECI